ncbi:MAG: hypothetical protein JKY41_14825 [Rhodobacteraceae bacterium]|nr:hypothetical protein [Paracoccaceae bacterium]
MSEQLVKLWSIFAPASDFLLAIALSALSALLIWFFRARVRIIWGSTNFSFHNFHIDPEKDPIAIGSEKFFVQNIGRKPASSIELVFSEEPTSYNLWPQRDHSSTALKNGGYAIQISSLAPHELLIVDIIDIDLKGPKLISVNCPDVMTNEVRFQVLRQFGKPVNFIVGYLMASGLVGTIYLILQMILGAN